MRIRIEAIQRLKPSTTPKGCRGFAAIVHHLSLFCSELQKVIKTYVLHKQRKGRVFLWRNEQQEAFDKLKGGYRSLQSSLCLTIGGDSTFNLPPVCLLLIMPLYLIQKEHSRLIAYISKRMPTTAQNYSMPLIRIVGIGC